MSTPKPTKTAEQQLLPFLQPPDPPPASGIDPVADAIMAEVQQGKQERFGQLFNSYHQRLLAVIRSSCPKGVDDEDIASETWMRVYRQAASYKLGTKFGAWLFRIGINVARDKHRRKKRETLGEDELFASIESNMEPPGEVLAAFEVYKSCFEGLEDREREIVECRTADNSNQIVATIFGLPEPRTAEIYQNAFRKLLNCIRGKLS